MEKLNEFEKHQLKVAKMIIDMPDVFRENLPGILSKEEAQEIINKLEAKESREETEKI